jgi:hypothetical protein
MSAIITIGDSYRTIRDIANTLFGLSWKDGDRRNTIDEWDDRYVWCLHSSAPAKPQPAPTWRNTFSSGNRVLTEEADGVQGEPGGLHDEPRTIRAVFDKPDGGAEYTFEGIFIEKSRAGNTRTFTRIAHSFDADEWKAEMKLGCLRYSSC